jgi:radical SAM protein with 4Fe4S-binding SPASM domain
MQATDALIFPITKYNYLELEKYFSLIEDETVFLSFIDDKDLKISPATFLKVFHALRHNYPNIELRILDFPFCFLPEADFFISNPKSIRKSYQKQCYCCKYQSICGGLYKGFKELLKPVPDLPSEVVIEVTARCNKDCRYCFNSFSKKIPDRSTDEIKKTIKHTSDLGIRYIRFTGGEPLLRKDIFELITYAKKCGLKVRLNTNGKLLTKEIAKKLDIDYILLPYNTYNDKTSLDAIKNLRYSKIKTKMVGTIITKQAIDNLEKFQDIIKRSCLDGWEFYRPISKTQPTTSTFRKLIDFIKKTGYKYPIANSFPFCSLGVQNMKEVSSCCLGATYDDGHSRLVQDPKGYFKPSYYLDENLGTDMLKAWNSTFMESMRNLRFTPSYCKDCDYLEKCKGGSRYLSNQQKKGNILSPDPLMKFQLKHLVIKPTSKCPRTCIGCASRQDLYKNMKETMTLSDWKKTIIQAKELGLEKLTISGGEPTLYKYLYELIFFSKSKGITTLINTTGLKVDPKKLIEAGLDGITFSLQSLDITTDKKIRNNDFVSNILKLIPLLKNKIQININTIVTRHNYKSLPKLHEYIHKHSLKWIISYPEYDKKNKLSLSHQEIKYYNKYVYHKIKIRYAPASLKASNKRKSCLVPSYFALILPNGDVHPCNIVEYAHEPVVGNVKNESLKKIWNNNYKEFRITKHKECKDCPIPLRDHVN